MGNILTSAILAGAMAMSSGCSFLLMRRPTERVDAVAAPRCTTQRAAPVADVMVALLTTMGTVAAVYIDAETGRDDLVVPAVMLGTEAVVYGASAVAGFAYAARCEEQFEEHAMFRSRRVTQ